MNDANDKLHKSIEEHDRIQDEIRVLLDRIQIVTDLEAENEALKKEKHELDEKLVNVEKQIKAIKQICQVQSAMLTYFGVSEDDVKEAANQIDTIRDLLQERLMSADAEIVESAYQELQDKAVEISVNIAKKTMKETNASSCTDRLSGLFTLPVWNRLSEKSRSFLVTADYTYENMIQQDSREEFDYSGVCLLVTKAVEVESCNRFFNEYKAYLVEKLGSNVDSWPDAMTKTDRFGRKYAAWDFTLGSVVHITGYDKEMNDVSFLDYASSVLYPGKEAIWIKNQLKSACEFVEKVRKDYRNPASHKESIKMVTAAECLDYVINVQKKLKEMIVYMNH